MMDNFCREDPFCVPVLAKFGKCVQYLPVTGLLEVHPAFLQKAPPSSARAKLIAEYNSYVSNNRKGCLQLGSPH